MLTEEILRQYADKYETKEFINGDPSWFMHQVNGKENQETIAFIASCLSYGNRKQFMPKIQNILDYSEGNVYKWVKSGEFEIDIPDNRNKCYYRLYTYHTMNAFLHTLQNMLLQYGSIGEFVKNSISSLNDGNPSKSDNKDNIMHGKCIDAVAAICQYFAANGIEGIIPKNTTSSCKRICMFLRWMVRSGSPVDLGLWKDIIDLRTLIIPMDTHVMQQAVKLGLLKNKTASMSAARQLSARMAEIFPEDPMKADFALFGYGINNK
ncbi:TIGR02757 family protein [Xylanibacter muris]|uniref:TIGR02757 family protein n=1 Tax=Xylanibacter muris TaxID=2736290 RepID=A0ABX2AS13_9BACT|nr:TIGR02757 family protein [Xylanibacter muris]NPD93010.1 TIGR02757 family protein [Xylanibacter muris]